MTEQLFIPLKPAKWLIVGRRQVTLLRPRRRRGQKSWRARPLVITANTEAEAMEKARELLGSQTQLVDCYQWDRD